MSMAVYAQKTHPVSRSSSPSRSSLSPRRHQSQQQWNSPDAASASPHQLSSNARAAVQNASGSHNSWNFSQTPLNPPAPSSAISGSTPRIDRGSITLSPLLAEDAKTSPSRDGSPDDLQQMQGDQDALPTSVFEHKPGTRGLHIRVPGGVPGGTPDYPDGIRWMQTIMTNAPLFGQTPPYVDFILPKDDKPFYFPDAQETATFSDNPSRTANNIKWDATLSLVGVHGHNITRIDSVNYGFDIDATGTVNLHSPKSTGVIDLVIHGDTLRSEYPDWSFGGGFAVPSVPKPAGSANSAEA